MLMSGIVHEFLMTDRYARYFKIKSGGFISRLKSEGESSPPSTTEGIGHIPRT